MSSQRLQGLFLPCKCVSGPFNSVIGVMPSGADTLADRQCRKNKLTVVGRRVKVYSEAQGWCPRARPFTLLFP